MTNKIYELILACFTFFTNFKKFWKYKFFSLHEHNNVRYLQFWVATTKFPWIKTTDLNIDNKQRESFGTKYFVEYKYVLSVTYASQLQGEGTSRNLTGCRRANPPLRVTFDYDFLNSIHKYKMNLVYILYQGVIFQFKKPLVHNIWDARFYNVHIYTLSLGYIKSKTNLKNHFDKLQFTIYTLWYFYKQI